MAVSESISSSMTNLSYTGLPVPVCCTSPEVRSDFQIWFSPGFPMQSRQARSDPSHGIVIPNSSSALILL